MLPLHQLSIASTHVIVTFIRMKSTIKVDNAWCIHRYPIDFVFFVLVIQFEEYIYILYFVFILFDVPYLRDVRWC